MNKIYYIDTENIRTEDWISILDYYANRSDPEEKYTVILFYTANSNPIPISCLRRLLDTGLELQEVECVKGPNALDFQLVYELGVRSSSDEEAAHYIISGDHGYDSAIIYASKYYKCSIKRYPKVYPYKEKRSVPLLETAPEPAKLVEKVNVPEVPPVSEESTVPEASTVPEESEVPVIREASEMPEAPADSEAPEVPEAPADSPAAESAQLKEELPPADLLFGIPSEAVDTIVTCIGKDQKAVLGMILTRAFGKETEQLLYKYIKSDAYTPADMSWPDPEVKVKRFIAAVLCGQENAEEEDVDTIYRIYSDSRALAVTKRKSFLKKEITAAFPEEKAAAYHELFRWLTGHMDKF